MCGTVEAMCGPVSEVVNASLTSLTQLPGSVTLQATMTCDVGKRFEDGLAVKTFNCTPGMTWDDVDFGSCSGQYLPPHLLYP